MRSSTGPLPPTLTGWLIFNVMVAVPPLATPPGVAVAEVTLGRMLSMVRCRFLLAGNVGLTALPAESVIEAPPSRLRLLMVRSGVFWPLPTV